VQFSKIDNSGSSSIFSSLVVAFCLAIISFTACIFLEDGKSYFKAYEVAMRIITDHCHGDHVLSEEGYKLFKNILIDQLKQYQSIQSWSGMKIWSDLLIRLLEHVLSAAVSTATPSDSVFITSSKDDLNALFISSSLKIDALLAMKNTAEAVDCAQVMLSRQISTKTLLPYFKALLYSIDISPENVVSKFLSFQVKYSNTLMPNSTEEDKFEQIDACCSVTAAANSLDGIDLLRKNKIILMLLKFKIKLFCDNESLKGDLKQEDIHGSSSFSLNYEKADEKTFVFSCCQYLTFFMKEFTFLKQQQQQQQERDQLQTGNGSSYSQPCLLDYFGDFFGNNGSNTNTLTTPRKTEVFITHKSSNKKKVNTSLASSPVNESKFSVLSSSDFLVMDKLTGLLETVHDIAGMFHLTNESSLSVLGKSTDIRFLADTLSNIGVSLVEYSKLLFHGDERLVVTVRSRQRSEILKLASEYLIQSEFIYSYLVIPTTDFNAILKVRVKLLIAATCSLLDYCEILHTFDSSASLSENIALRTSDFSSSVSSTSDHSLSESSTKMLTLDAGNLASKLIGMSFDLLNKCFDFADEEDKLLYSSSIILEFVTFNEIGELSKSESFVSSKLNDLQYCQIDELRMIVEILLNCRKFSLECLRMFLSHIITLIQHQKQINNYKYIGWIYRKLIEISPSRKHALDKIQEFEQFLRNNASSSSTQASSSSSSEEALLNIEDIDQILCLSYNYAVTLIELDQLSLAEQFLLKGFSIVNHASETMKAWKPRMEVSFFSLISSSVLNCFFSFLFNC
jgi:hypothetical protein